MGGVLPKPVTSIVLRRHGGLHFHVGLAEMNGWRKSMEDAHVVSMKDAWGCFGVFDGHGGAQCSKFISRRFTEELEKKVPTDDAAVSELVLRLDREFLATKQPSGSTGTFAFVQTSPDAEGNHLLRVGNVGDSRVLLGRPDGTIVEGAGTDGGLTTDHKPDHDSERERIERTGGRVEMVQGVARVNGDLAVSRAFGDANHKETGGPAQEDHPVSAAPELFTLKCKATDFLLLVCDGISEGEFPNREVVKLVASELQSQGDTVDPSLVAAAVCRKAIECGSQDNLSCMIVLFGGKEVLTPHVSLLPGPFDAPDDDAFRKAYAAMAEHAGLTLAQAVEMRYDSAHDAKQKLLEDAGVDHTIDQSFIDLSEELAFFGEGPLEGQTRGSAERVAWFKKWLEVHDAEKMPDLMSMSRPEMLAALDRKPDLIHMAAAHGMLSPRNVRVGALKQLKSAMESSNTLKWSESHAKLCGALGIALVDDPSDGTSRVSFPNHGFGAWLPTEALIDEDDDTGLRTVRVGSLELLRAAVEANASLKWFEKLVDVADQQGVVIMDDVSDGTSQVKFPDPVNVSCWLPTAMLHDVESDVTKGVEDTGDNDDKDAKRQRVG